MEEKTLDRLERWRRRLLDLTLRNTLHDSKPGKNAVAVECTDAGVLEDLLASQKTAALEVVQRRLGDVGLYRLEWQTAGSLQRRLRNCTSGVRAEPFPFDAPELVDLEAYLMERAAGLAVETSAVRP